MAVLTENSRFGGQSGPIGTNDLAMVNRNSANRIRGSLYSDDYVAGATGWKISSDLAEFANIFARGRISSVSFVQDYVSGVSGTVMVCNGTDTLEVDMTAADVAKIKITGSATFAAADMLRIKDDTNDEWFKVVSVSGNEYSVERDKAGVYPPGMNPPWQKGSVVLNYGGTNDGFVFITAESLFNGPNVSIRTNGSTPWAGTTERVRIGNLNGFLSFAAKVFGFATGDATNHIYYNGTVLVVETPNFSIDASGNVTMSGAITASSGSIAGWTIDATRIYKSGIEMDSANSRVKVFTGDNYVTMSPSGLIGYDSVLGQVFKLLTDGSAPEFSSGVIKEVEFQMYTSGVFKTAADPSSTGGFIANNTAMRGYNSAGLKLFEVIYDGTDEGDFYVGDYDNDNQGWFYDHSAELMSYIGSLNDRTPWISIDVTDTDTGVAGSHFTATPNTRYLVDTTGGWFRIFLSDAGDGWVTGDWVTWVDEKLNFGEDMLKIQTNAYKIEGYGPDATGLYVECNWPRCNGTLLYISSSYGFKLL